MSFWELFFEDVVNEARVLARPRKRAEADCGEASGEVGEGKENAGCEGDRFEDESELYD